MRIVECTTNLALCVAHASLKGLDTAMPEEELASSVRLKNWALGLQDPVGHPIPRTTVDKKVRFGPKVDLRSLSRGVTAVLSTAEVGSPVARPALKRPNAQLPKLPTCGVRGGVECDKDIYRGLLSASQQSNLSVVACIPAFDEEQTIAGVVVMSQRYVDKVVVCDDGSSDMTADIAEKLGALVIRHERNVGKGEAMRSLFLRARESGADVMVTLDGDGQHDPSEIPKLVDVIKRGDADVVIGSRFASGTNVVPRHREAVNKILNTLTAGSISDTQSGFRAYSRRAVVEVTPAEMGMGVDSQILIDALQKGLRVVEVPVSVKYGIGRTSKKNAAYHTLDVVTSVVKLTSIRHPLLVYGGSGVALVIAAFYFFYKAVDLFLTSKALEILSLTYGLVAFALIVMGLLTFFTGVILFTITTLLRQGR